MSVYLPNQVGEQKRNFVFIGSSFGREFRHAREEHRVRCPQSVVDLASFHVEDVASEHGQTVDFEHAKDDSFGPFSLLLLPSQCNSSVSHVLQLVEVRLKDALRLQVLHERETYLDHLAVTFLDAHDEGNQSEQRVIQSQVVENYLRYRMLSSFTALRLCTRVCVLQAPDLLRRAKRLGQFPEFAKDEVQLVLLTQF